MNWFGSGLITILLYGSNEGSIADNSRNILTENSLDIMTESSQNIDTSS